MAMLAAYFVVALYKVYLLATGKSVYWFAVVSSIEFAIVGFSLLGVYHGQGGQKLTASLAMAKKLFSRSRYYIMSSVMVTFFQNTDHVMLQIMMGDAENGIYTAAVTCTTVVSFVYSAIIDSARPVILENKKAGTSAYEAGISKLYCITTYLSLLQGVGFSLLAKPIVMVLFGESYMAAVPVLRILIWYLSFSLMGRVRNIWILAEEKQQILWKINLSGAIMNIVVNAMVIPLWGAAGAALASLLTQIFTNFVLSFIMEPLRENVVLLLKGIAPQSLVAVLKEIKVSMHNPEKGKR